MSFLPAPRLVASYATLVPTEDDIAARGKQCHSQAEECVKATAPARTTWQCGLLEEVSARTKN